MMQESSNQDQQQSRYPLPKSKLPYRQPPHVPLPSFEDKSSRQITNWHSYNHMSRGYFDYEMRQATKSQHVTVPVTPEQDFKNYVKERIFLYRKKAAKLRVMQNILQIMLLIETAFISIIITFSDIPKYIPAIISAIAYGVPSCQDKNRSKIRVNSAVQGAV